MSNLKKIWVVDTRQPDQKPFLFAEHLLPLTKHLKKSDRPRPTTQRVTEPETPNNDATVEPEAEKPAATSTVNEPAASKAKKRN